MSGSRLTYVIRYRSADDGFQNEETLSLASAADAVQIAKIRLRAMDAFDHAQIFLNGRQLYTVRRLEALVQGFPTGPEDPA